MLLLNFFVYIGIVVSLFVFGVVVVVFSSLLTQSSTRAGSILGVTNTAGVFSCLIANKFIASSVSTSTNTGFAKVFLALALMYVFCGTLWIRTMKGDRLDGKKNVVAL